MAKQVIEFCNTQKNNQKSLAAKYNTGMDKSSASYAFFRNKHSKTRVAKMLEQAQ